MPLSLVHRVPSTARSLFTLDEDEHLIPASPSFDRKIGAYTLTEHIGAGASGSNDEVLETVPLPADRDQITVECMREFLVDPPTVGAENAVPAWAQPPTKPAPVPVPPGLEAM